MRCLIIFLILFGNVMVYTQSYVPFLQAGNYWEEISGVDIYGICPASVARYTLGEDTIINGREYKIMEATPLLTTGDPMFLCPPYFYDSTVAKTEVAYLREDTIERKVYYFNLDYSNDSLFYDFSLSVGDTTTSYQIVTSIDSIQLLDGSFRRHIHFDSGDLGWIEGLGNPNGLWSPEHTIMGIFDYGFCYGRFHTDLFNNGGACGTLLNSTRISNLHDVDVSPNPSYNFISIEGLPLGKKPKKVTLSNATGKFYDADFSDFKINISHIPQGVYFLHIEGEGFRVVQKIIKL